MCNRRFTPAGRRSMRVARVCDLEHVGSSFDPVGPHSASALFSCQRAELIHRIATTCVGPRSTAWRSLGTVVAIPNINSGNHPVPPEHSIRRPGAARGTFSPGAALKATEKSVSLHPNRRDRGLPFWVSSQKELPRSVGRVGAWKSTNHIPIVVAFTTSDHHPDLHATPPYESPQCTQRDSTSHRPVPTSWSTIHPPWRDAPVLQVSRRSTN